MKGSKGNRAPDAFENPERSQVVLSLTTVHKMLPLVRRILDDILDCQKSLLRLQPEEQRLDRQRRTLDWPSRQRRYNLKDELAAAEHRLNDAKEELHGLGVVLLDGAAGRVGFPTMVNNRPAFFSWHSGEEGLNSWHFAEEEGCRPIPPAWLKEISLLGKN
ncbi:MAG: DUF2203 family protein [Planctomycetes bacterium]|nr:DUF2203 family protein [Planctomycetota bacterium]